jgi:hypothetical protein
VIIYHIIKTCRKRKITQQRLIIKLNINKNTNILKMLKIFSEDVCTELAAQPDATELNLDFNSQALHNNHIEIISRQLGKMTKLEKITLNLKK